MGLVSAMGGYGLGCLYLFLFLCVGFAALAVSVFQQLQAFCVELRVVGYIRCSSIVSKSAAMLYFLVSIYLLELMFWLSRCFCYFVFLRLNRRPSIWG